MFYSWIACGVVHKWNQINPMYTYQVILVFDERGKPESDPEKNLLEQIREPTNSTHIWRRMWESNSSHK